MENQNFNPEDVGIFNVGTLSKIAAKQNAIMHMLSFLIAETPGVKETAQEIFDRYTANAAQQADIIADGFKAL